MELLDGTLKLRHCTEVFTMRFSPRSLPKVGDGGGKRQLVNTGHLPDASSTVGKRVRLTRKTRPGVISHTIPDPGHSTPRRWKRLPPPFLRRRGERGGRASQSFSSPWGWVFFFSLGDAWNLPSEGIGVGVCAAWTVQPKGPVHFHWSV